MAARALAAHGDVELGVREQPSSAAYPPDEVAPARSHERVISFADSQDSMVARSDTSNSATFTQMSSAGVSKRKLNLAGKDDFKKLLIDVYYLPAPTTLETPAPVFRADRDHSFCNSTVFTAFVIWGIYATALALEFYTAFVEWHFGKETITDLSSVALTTSLFAFALGLGVLTITVLARSLPWTLFAVFILFASHAAWAVHMAIRITAVNTVSIWENNLVKATSVCQWVAFLLTAAFIQYVLHYEEAKWLLWWPVKTSQLATERQAFEKLVKTMKQQTFGMIDLTERLLADHHNLQDHCSTLDSQIVALKERIDVHGEREQRMLHELLQAASLEADMKTLHSEATRLRDIELTLHEHTESHTNAMVQMRLTIQDLQDTNEALITKHMRLMQQQEDDIMAIQADLKATIADLEQDRRTIRLELDLTRAENTKLDQAMQDLQGKHQQQLEAVLLEWETERQTTLKDMELHHSQCSRRLEELTAERAELLSELMLLTGGSDAPQMIALHEKLIARAKNNQRERTEEREAVERAILEARTREREMLQELLVLRSDCAAAQLTAQAETAVAHAAARTECAKLQADHDLKTMQLRMEKEAVERELAEARNRQQEIQASLDATTTSFDRVKTEFSALRETTNTIESKAKEEGNAALLALKAEILQFRSKHLHCEDQQALDAATILSLTQQLAQLKATSEAERQHEQRDMSQRLEQLALMSQTQLQHIQASSEQQVQTVVRQLVDTTQQAGSAFQALGSIRGEAELRAMASEDAQAQLAVMRPQLGCSFGEPVFEESNSRGAAAKILGIQLQQILPNLAADQAGLRPGDVVKSIDGKATHTRAQFKQALANAKPGQKLGLLVLRQTPKGPVISNLTVRLGGEGYDANEIDRLQRLAAGAATTQDLEIYAQEHPHALQGVEQIANNAGVEQARLLQRNLSTLGDSLGIQLPGAASADPNASPLSLSGAGGSTQLVFADPHHNARPEGKTASDDDKDYGEDFETNEDAPLLRHSPNKNGKTASDDEYGDDFEDTAGKGVQFSQSVRTHSLPHTSRAQPLQPQQQTWNADTSDTASSAVNTSNPTSANNKWAAASSSPILGTSGQWLGNAAERSVGPSALSSPATPFMLSHAHNSTSAPVAFGAHHFAAPSPLTVDTPKGAHATAPSSATHASTNNRRQLPPASARSASAGASSSRKGARGRAASSSRKAAFVADEPMQTIVDVDTPRDGNGNLLHPETSEAAAAAAAAGASAATTGAGTDETPWGVEWLPLHSIDGSGTAPARGAAGSIPGGAIRASNQAAAARVSKQKKHASRDTSPSLSNKARPAPPLRKIRAVASPGSSNMAAPSSSSSSSSSARHTLPARGVSDLLSSPAQQAAPLGALRHSASGRTLRPAELAVDRTRTHSPVHIRRGAAQEFDPKAGFSALLPPIQNNPFMGGMGMAASASSSSLHAGHVGGQTTPPVFYDKIDQILTNGRPPPSSL